MKKQKLLIVIAVLLVSLAFPGRAFAVTNTTIRNNTSTAISTFSVKELSDGSYEASWRFTRTTASAYVAVYLTTDTYSNNGTLLGGTDSTGSGKLEFELPDTDPGYYHFMLSAESDNGSIAYSYTNKEFFIENENRAEELSNVLAARSEEQVFMTWDGEGDVVVYLYDDDTKELLLARNFNSKPCSIDIPSGHENVCAGAAAVVDGLAGNFTPVPCSLTDAPAISVNFESSPVTNNPEYAFSVDRASGYTLRVFRDRNEIAEETPGSGYYVVPISEGTNNIMIFASDSKGRTAYTEHEVTLDTKAPFLTLVDTAEEFRTTQDKVYIKGRSEKGAMIICDYEEVPLVGEAFCIEKKLSNGDNTIALLAVDEAGNETAITINAERTFWSADHKNAALFIGLGVLAACVEILYLIMRRKGRKKK